MQISGKGDEQRQESSAAAADPLRFGPNPDQLIPKLPQDSEAAEGGVYRPPRLNPVSMDDDPDKDYGKKERRRQQHAARKAGRSEFVQALASELEGAPEEVNPGPHPPLPFPDVSSCSHWSNAVCVVCPIQP